MVIFPPAIFAFVACLAGAAFGSYAVTAGMRMARLEQSTSGRSRCDRCDHPLSFAQTVPLVSYAALRGRCRHCGDQIDALHTAGEIAGAIVLLGSVLVGKLVQSVTIAAIGLVLVAACAVDWKTFRLPNLLVGTCAILCAWLSALHSPEHLFTGALAAAGCIALLQVLRVLSWRSRGSPGLGLGDVKLLAALALWLGAFTPWMVAAASFVGLLMMLIVRPEDGRLPFGPAIALAGWSLGVGMEAGWWSIT